MRVSLQTRTTAGSYRTRQAMRGTPLRGLKLALEQVKLLLFPPNPSSDAALSKELRQPGRM